MHPKSAQNDQTTQQPPPAVMQILAEEEASDSRFFRWSMGLAVAAHVFFFATNWGFLAFGGETDEVEQVKQILYVVKQVKFEVPPKIEHTTITKPRRTIPIPDATPDDPEPIRQPELIEESPFEDPDVVLELVDAPPIEEEHVGPYPVGDGVKAPVRISGPDPIYTRAAAMARKEGAVILECIIGKDGRVLSITPLHRLGFGLTEAAISAVERWIFEPSTLNGKPVVVQYNLTVRFTNPR